MGRFSWLWHTPHLNSVLLWGMSDSQRPGSTHALNLYGDTTGLTVSQLDQPGLYPSQAQAAFNGPRHSCPNVVT